MKSYEMKQLVVDKVKATKKVSRVYDDFGKDMAYYFAMVNRFNAMPRNAVSVDGVPTDKIPLIDVLKGCIIPNSVTVSGKESENDFVCREEVKETFPLDVDRMRNIVSAFYSMYKREAPECTLASAKTDEALSAGDFSKNCSVEGVCVTDEPSRLPVPVSIKVFRESRYVFGEDEVVREVLDRKFKELAR